MSDMQLPRLARDFNAAGITATRADDGRVTLEFPASSDIEVERWWGTEVLSHDKESVRMERIDGKAAPLLFNHNWDDPVGMIDSGTLKDGRLYVTANLFDTARAKEVQAMIDGGLRNVSIGYEIHTMEEEPKKQRFTATSWTPLEAPTTLPPPWKSRHSWTTKAPARKSRLSSPRPTPASCTTFDLVKPCRRPSPDATPRGVDRCR